MDFNYQKNLEDASPTDAMLQMMSGFWVARGIHVAAKLGLADYLKDGAKTAEQLAALTGTHADSLHRVLRMLAMAGVFQQDEKDCFALTPLSETLRTDVPGSLRLAAMIELGEEHYEAFGNILHSVKTGDIAFDNRFGMSIWEYFGRHPEKAELFNRHMVSTTEPVSRAVAERYDCSAFSKVVDIGGGLGGMIAALLKANPRLEGVLFDAPSVIEKSKDFLAGQGLGERCATVGGDFFESVPAGGDLYTMRWIIHDWEDSKSIRILKNIRHVIPENGKLILAEAVVPAGGQPHFSKFFDLVMLTMTGGRERTASEYSALFEQSGFKLTRVVPTETFLSIIEAVPA